MPVPYDPVGALGGTFAPGYTRSDPQSVAAVDVWNAAHLKVPPGFVGQPATFAPGYVGSDPASVAAVQAYTAAHQGQPFTPAPPPPAPPPQTAAAQQYIQEHIARYGYPPEQSYIDQTFGVGAANVGRDAIASAVTNNSGKDGKTIIGYDDYFQPVYG